MQRINFEIKESLLIVFLCFLLFAHSQEKSKDVLIFFDTIPFLVPPKNVPKTFGGDLLVFSDPNLDGLAFTKSLFNGTKPNMKPIEILNYIWRTDFYQNSSTRAPIIGFFQHFKNKEVFLIQKDTLYQLHVGARNIDYTDDWKERE